jgi:glycolate oxidase iron-sulfur subunit
MQTDIHDQFRALPGIDEADRILRTCVHCGFCNATCPTYLELGDERDGPRGRIYLIKQLLEGGPASRRTQIHLDRCLTCRNCETTCPSGVEYGKLVDFGRGIVEQRVRRPLRERLLRWLLMRIVPYKRRFGLALGVARTLRPLLPAALRAKLPARQSAGSVPTRTHARLMLALEGCAQAAATPRTQAAAARALDKLGIELSTVPAAGCCGALGYHLGAHSEGRAFMKRNIDAWWPAIERGAEAIVTTASGCGVMVKDYGHALREDPDYAEKAARVARLAKDIGEVLAGEDLSPLTAAQPGKRVAFHCPCTLQHGQGLGGTVEPILKRLGYTLTAVPNAHLDSCIAASAVTSSGAPLARTIAISALVQRPGSW